MKPPNFFIVGAPKCGTTSLAFWLERHPNIFFCPGKEPHFYNTDLLHRNTYSRKSYFALFKKANEDHIAVGEASVYYLFSRKAVPNIEREGRNVRYIVMLRNPVDMAYSLHGQRLYSGNEHIVSFEKAWNLSPERRKGNDVKNGCRDARLSDYQMVCSLGSQVEQLLRVVPRDRVHLIVLDDLKANPRYEYLKILEFLGVPDDGQKEFPVKNQAREVRWHLGHEIVKTIKQYSRNTKKSLGISISRKSGILKWIDNINKKTGNRNKMNRDLELKIKHYFREDILLLGRLINRDFSFWIETKPEKAINLK